MTDAQADLDQTGSPDLDDRLRRALTEASDTARIRTPLIDESETFSPELLLARLTEILVRRQAVFNDRIMVALNELVEREEREGHRLLAEIQDRLSSLEDHREARDMNRLLPPIHDRLNSLESDLRMQRARLDLLLREARRRLPEPFDKDQLGTFSDLLERRFDSLYSDLENAFRGSRNDIREKQSPYLADFRHLVGQETHPLLDVGCGRGEWLELLQEEGISAYGIDVSDAFVESGRQRGLDVRLEDAVEHLKNLPTGSLGAITAFHVIEHLEFSTLLEFLDACLVALRPGGLVLFETPNPTNLTVGASTFYLDPTHKVPLHPELTKFVLESRGFEDTEIRHIHPAPEFEMFDTLGVTDGAVGELLDRVRRALFGPQDYAAVAWAPPGMVSQGQTNEVSNA